MDINSIKNYYSGISDEKLIHHATHDIQGLTPEAQIVIKEEINKRGLNELLEGSKIDLTKLSQDEFQVYVDIIRNLQCPNCKSKDEKLNAILVSKVISAIFFTNSEEEIKIACPECLNKYLEKADASTAAKGFFALPWGIVKSTQALSSNDNMRKLLSKNDPTQFLRGFVYQNIRYIESFKNNKEKLYKLIDR